MQTNSLSSTSATKIYINLEIPQVVEIIDKCIFLKFIITKKSNKYNILSHKMPLKKFNDRNGQKHDLIQEIPKIHAKQFS